MTYTYTIGGVDYATSQITSMVDASGTSSYTYDTQGRVTSYTPPVGLDSGYYVSYDYNRLGQKLYAKITNGTTTSYDARYEYYANGSLKNVKNGTSDMATYTYDIVGNRIGTAYANGTSTTYAYDSTDPRYQLNTITHKKGANTIAEIDYTAIARDKVGNPKSMTDWTGTWDYGYDKNNRLTSAAPPNPVPEQPAGGSYGYDWVGNRINPPYGDNAMVYNAADQLISWPGMYSYSYYNNGSLEEVRNAQGILVSRYTYHSDGLLYQASYMGDRTATNTWDANSNRVGLTINGKVCTFVYDRTAGIPAVIEEVVDEVPVYYYREPSGALIARTDAVNSIRYYHFDALGSTRLLTKANGDTTNRYSYDAWGTVVAHDRYEGSINQPYQYVGRYGYYTHYQDSDFKLLQLGVRFYDPSIGRFTQRDPIGDGINWYAYASGNPILRSDPLGLWDLGESAPYMPKCYENCMSPKQANNVEMKISNCSIKVGDVVSEVIPVPIIGTVLGKGADYASVKVVKSDMCKTFCQEQYHNRKLRGEDQKDDFQIEDFISWMDLGGCQHLVPAKHEKFVPSQAGSGYDSGGKKVEIKDFCGLTRTVSE